MERKVIVVLYILVSLMLTSCSKVDALFSNGEPVTEERELDHRFIAISMYNNVNVTLKQSSHPHLELTCPENLIEKVTTEIEGDTLYIKNENDYNWLRSYDYSIDLTVYYDSLRQIDYASIGSLTCAEGDSIKGVGIRQTNNVIIIDTTFNAGTILSIDTTIYTEFIYPKTFFININEGCGDIDLNLKCDVVKNDFINGTSCVTLRGKVNYTVINMRSYGVVHAENLYSNIVRVKSESTNDAYVRFASNLYASIFSIGNVYYIGDSRKIVPEGNGDGQIIPLP